MRTGPAMRGWPLACASLVWPQFGRLTCKVPIGSGLLVRASDTARSGDESMTPHVSRPGTLSCRTDQRAVVAGPQRLTGQDAVAARNPQRLAVTPEGDRGDVGA